MNREDSSDEMPNHRVASDKTHSKAFDLGIPKQWVFGYTL